MDNSSNKRVLVIKLSPVNGLNSSTMRTLALMKGLVKEGCQVDIVTVRENYNTVKNDLSSYDFMEKVGIYYAGGNSAYNKIIKPGGGLKKRIVRLMKKVYYTFAVDDYTGSIAKNIKIDILPVKEYDCVISVSDPKTSHKAMIRLISQGLKYKKWVQYWGDPMASDITKKSIYPRFVYRRLEKKLFDKADSIVYTSPFTLEEQKKLYPAFADRMSYVPTAYIEEKVYPSAGNEKYTVGYYGAYKSYVRNIMPLYDACRRMENVQLYIVGNSDISLESTDNVTVLPRGDISGYEAVTDLYICVMNLCGSQIPGKAYHYAATNRPVLVVLDGENKDGFADFFRQFGRYELCGNTPDEIRAAIEKIMATDSGEYQPYEGFSCEKVAGMVVGTEL